MQLDVLVEQKSLIKGDAKCVSIAAASILAKTHRDMRMEEWDAVYPLYGLAQHKGYGTPEHLEALRIHGPTPCTATRLPRCVMRVAGRPERYRCHYRWKSGLVATERT